MAAGATPALPVHDRAARSVVDGPDAGVVEQHPRAVVMTMDCEHWSPPCLGVSATGPPPVPTTVTWASPGPACGLGLAAQLAGVVLAQEREHRFHGSTSIHFRPMATGRFAGLVCILPTGGSPLGSHLWRIGMRQSIEGALGVWSDGPGPLHRKLSDAVRAAAESGRLPAGERLPSERELAQRLAVSRSTVVTAYDTLRSEGLLVSRQGSGTRIRPGAAARPDPLDSFQVSPVYRTLIDARDDVISLACAIFPAHPLVAEAIREVVLEEGDKLLAQNGYLPGGLPALREGLADMLSARGTPTTPEQVMVTTGAQQAVRSEEHTSELQSLRHLVCRLLLEKKKQ